MAERDTATLYLRGMPRHLVREAKAEAARRGMSLTAFAREALSRALGADRGRGRAPEGVGAIRADLDWFARNRRRLVRRYRDEYVAIVNRRIVDHDADFDALARRVFATYGVRSIAMPKVTPAARVADIPTPRVAR